MQAPEEVGGGSSARAAQPYAVAPGQPANAPDAPWSGRWRTGRSGRRARGHASSRRRSDVLGEVGELVGDPGSRSFSRSWTLMASQGWALRRARMRGRVARMLGARHATVKPSALPSPPWTLAHARPLPRWPTSSLGTRARWRSQGYPRLVTGRSPGTLSEEVRMGDPEVLIGAALGALLIATLTFPTSAADPKGTLAFVNGIPGKRVDVCLERPWGQSRARLRSGHLQERHRHRRKEPEVLRA